MHCVVHHSASLPHAYHYQMIKDLLDPVSLLYKIKLPVPGLMSDPAADPVCMSVYMGKPRPNSTGTSLIHACVLVRGQQAKSD